MFDQSTSSESPKQQKTICTRVEFDCEVCGLHVAKKWHPKFYGKPRFCSRTCKSNFQRQAKPVTKEWLEKKYVVEGLDCTQIALLVKRNPKSVWNWLKDFDIPTRKRGQTGNGKGNAWHPSKGTPPPFLGKKHKPETLAKMRGRIVSRATGEKIRNARLRDGGVPYLVNGQHWLKGKRKDQHPNWKGGITPERQAFYETKEWKKAARAVWKRDGGFCQRCERHYDDDESLDFDIHHIVGFACVELRAEVCNLVLLCEECHYWVHSRENVSREFIEEK